ncbi:hypothetical protein SDC9_69031 [bioreactor metagenome]|uniref:Uncharacterized protein n=1 Tax=bioreactor metagenome TaxID=1076179 RepID=A0A644Y8Y7_9ZZZZ
MIQVVQEDADDLAEAQRHDGQIVTAQLQHRYAQQHPGACRQYQGQRNHHPQRQMQPVGELRGKPREVLTQVGRRQQAEHIGTHRVEGHIAQVQQTGVAHHDVEAQRQHHIQQRQVGNAHPGVAEILKNQGQHQQRNAAQHPVDGFLVLAHGSALPQARSATRSPSRPEGRSVSRMIRTMNAKMSA